VPVPFLALLQAASSVMNMKYFNWVMAIVLVKVLFGYFLVVANHQKTGLPQVLMTVFFWARQCNYCQLYLRRTLVPYYFFQLFPCAGKTVFDNYVEAGKLTAKLHL